MMYTRRLALRAGICAAAAVLAAPIARADREHDQARQAVERGEAQPLADILARLRPQLGGELVGTSFKRKDGRWIYEFKVIRPSGRLTEFHVDAKTAEILKEEQE